MSEEIRREINKYGFAIADKVFSESEVNAILYILSKLDTSHPNFKKSKDLFAIRQFFKEVPEIIPHIFTDTFNRFIKEVLGEDFFAVKSIYFDKPETSNWFVTYHQDLTISVDRKEPIQGFGPWTTKQGQFAVQPPLYFLEQNFTLRIHLDNTDESNGALRVIPKSHLKGIYRPETIDWNKEREVQCNVTKGGVMIMKPLLLHASSKSKSTNKRRVIHIEFSNQTLPKPLNWSELLK